METLSSDYEQFIADLVRDVQRTHRHITDLGSGRDNMLRGVSGQDHQIDVSFVDHDFEHPTLVIIECKRFTNDPIKLEHVKVVKATMDDVLIANDMPNHANAIIVTTIGAQKGAHRFAAYYGIRIQQVSHGPSYTFSYKNVTQIGIAMGVKCSATFAATLIRACQSCGQSFEVKDNQKLCPSCSIKPCGIPRQRQSPNKEHRSDDFSGSFL